MSQIILRFSKLFELAQKSFLFLGKFSRKLISYKKRGCVYYQALGFSRTMPAYKTLFPYNTLHRNKKFRLRWVKLILE